MRLSFQLYHLTLWSQKIDLESFPRQEDSQFYHLALSKQSGQGTRREAALIIFEKAECTYLVHEHFENVFNAVLTMQIARLTFHGEEELFISLRLLQTINHEFDSL